MTRGSPEAMRVLLYREFGELAEARLPQPSPAEDEVLIRVSACGICGSELESFRSRSPRRPPPLVMGHEFCGIVERAEEAAGGFAPGDRVVGNSLVACGRCERCLRGDDHLCADRQLFGMHRAGAFADYVTAPARCLVRWPASLEAEAACLAEPLANGIHMVRLTQHLAPATVLIIGAGPIGLLALQAFRAMTKARVAVTDLNERRLRTAAELGADRVIAAGTQDSDGALRAFAGRDGADVVIDAVGAETTKLQSLRAVRPSGAAVWIGLGEDEIRLPSHSVTLRESHIFGSYGARLEELGSAVGLLASGAVATRSWTTSAPLREGAALFDRMLGARGDDIKGILVP